MEVAHSELGFHGVTVESWPREPRVQDLKPRGERGSLEPAGCPVNSKKGGLWVHLLEWSQRTAFACGLKVGLEGKRGVK